MRVDAARQHVASRRVDVADSGQTLAKSDHAPIAHADVGPLRVRRGDYKSVSDDQIEGAAHVLHMEGTRERAPGAGLPQRGKRSDQIGVKIGANPGCFWRQSCLAL